MSSEEEDILNKMDALLKRHQPVAPAVVEIPTLTEVVAAPEADATLIPTLTEIVQESPAAAVEAIPEPFETKIIPQRPQLESAQHEDLSKSIAALVNDWLERNMPDKLDQLDAHIQELVSETVAQEMLLHMDSLSKDLVKLVQEEVRKASARTQ
jgi:hypothetical protein